MKPRLIILIVVAIALAIVAYPYLLKSTSPILTPTLASPSPSQVTSGTILAYSIGKMIAKRGSRPNPDLDKKPKVGDTCPHCKGTGKEPGDGTINISCGQCKGDGKVDEGDPILSGQIELPELDILFQDEKKITVSIEGIVYTYEPKNGYFYTPDRAWILSIDPIPPENIGSIKSIETCDEATGLCREYLLQDK